MSRSYREFCERYPGIAQMYDTDDRALAELRREEQSWLADQAAQAEYQSWLDTMNEVNHDME